MRFLLPQTIRRALGITAPLLLLAGSAVAQDKAPPGHKNLQVLPPDISRQELGTVMLANLKGLGLPRLEGRGCLYCHVGDLEQPRESWDWASDAKPAKRKARVMMAMVRDINGKYLANLEERIGTGEAVTCNTCHGGRTDPRPLHTVLQESYDNGGIEHATDRYRTLREKYFGGDAYDFRPRILSGLAYSLADHSLDDAIALAKLNQEFNAAEAAVQQDLMRLLLEKTLETRGVEAVLAEVDRRASALGPAVLTPNLLDSLGWRLMRTERQDKALPIFLANRARFPNEYLTHESVAFVLARSSEDRPQAFQILEDWLEDHPDHDRARRLLVNLRAREP